MTLEKQIEGIIEFNSYDEATKQLLALLTEVLKDLVGEKQAKAFESRYEYSTRHTEIIENVFRQLRTKARTKYGIEV